MAQRPKQHVRQAIVEAAVEELSAAGLGGATLAGIARRAGTSVGNVYKYFPDKEALFHAAVPPELVARLELLLRRRVAALGRASDVEALIREKPYRAASKALEDLALAHRAELLFLLRHGAQTEHASFADDLAAMMTGLAFRYARRAWPKVKVTPGLRRAVRRSYRAWLVAIADILAEERSEAALRASLWQFTAYHLAGLEALFTHSPPGRAA